MRALLSFIPFLQLCLATKVYLSPPVSVPSRLAPERASLALAHHLGLEAFEPLYSSSESAFAKEIPFVGQGSKSGVIVSVDEEDLEHITPSSLKPSFTLVNSPPADSLSSIISTYLTRAQQSHDYASIYSISSSPPEGSRFLDLFDMLPNYPEIETFYSELQAISAFLDSAADSESVFAAVELAGLAQIRTTFGVESDEYKLSSAASRAALESAISQSEKISLALMTFDSTVVKRQQSQQLAESQAPLPPVATPQPIGSVSSCFTSMDACTNGTSSCSGRGECAATSRAGKTCYTCSCGSTKSSTGSTENWVGERCEKKDLSAPFTLLAGTTIVMLLIIVGSVSLLATAGSQELPSVLMGGAVNAKKE
jgi:hypothetical protein